MLKMYRSEGEGHGGIAVDEGGAGVQDESAVLNDAVEKAFTKPKPEDKGEENPAKRRVDAKPERDRRQAAEAQKETAIEEARRLAREEANAENDTKFAARDALEDLKVSREFLPLFAGAKSPDEVADRKSSLEAFRAKVEDEALANAMGGVVKQLEQKGYKLVRVDEADAGGAGNGAVNGIAKAAASKPAGRGPSLDNMTPKEIQAYYNAHGRLPD